MTEIDYTDKTIPALVRAEAWKNDEGADGLIANSLLLDVLEEVRKLKHAIQRQGATLFYETAAQVLGVGFSANSKVAPRTLYACQHCGKEFGDGEETHHGRCPNCNIGIGDPIGTIEDD